MTDYGQFFDEEGKLLKSDPPETGVLAEKNKKAARCTTNGTIKDIIRYAKKLNAVRKEASDAGICLDELEEAAKELA